MTAETETAFEILATLTAEAPIAAVREILCAHGVIERDEELADDELRDMAADYFGADEQAIRSGLAALASR